LNEMQDSTLQEIKDRLNVADIIGGYIQLKKAGTNFKALCPFHNEKTPSLQISPQKQIWHCFGCGEGGDVFGFVMKFENLEFKEALKLLADKAGVKLPEYRPKDPKEQSEKDLLLRINDFAARFYHRILVADKRGDFALEYLKKRGLSLGTIKQWQIGFAPEDFHTLEKALAAKKVSPNDLVKAGVSSRNEGGQIYDRFRGRITFPIFDASGNTVGFSARILRDDQKSAKYVNSPETAVYSKSKILFGLNFAKNEIRKKDEAVIVEGQMDCISAHQAGFTNVVASSGTALTEDQLALLSRLTKNLKFCFDADTAGLAASRRAGELALKKGFRLKVISLKAVKDPDELIKKSPGLWEKAVSEAGWFIDFYMDLARSHAPQDNVGQLHFLSSQVVPLLSFIQDPLEQDHYIKKLAEQYGASERAVRELLKPQKFSSTQKSPSLLQAPNFALEKEVLGGLLFSPDFLSEVKAKAGLEDFENPEIREILSPLFQSGKEALADKSSTLAKEAIFMVESQLDDLDGSEQVLLRDLKKSLAMLRLGAIKKQQQLLNQEIKRAETSSNKVKLNELNQQFAILTEKRLEFEKLV
jgi:DNA primase